MREEYLGVLHVVSRDDQEALRTLSLTTRVLAALGVGQMVVTLDEGRGAQASPLPAMAADVRPLPCAELFLVGKIRALHQELAKVSGETILYAVHLHGFGPCLLGARALSGASAMRRVLYSPYLTPLRSAWMTALLGRVIRNQPPGLEYAAIAASLPEAQLLSKLLNRSAEVLPHPVSDVFFAVQRREAARPSVLAQGCGVEAVDLATRLSVLLNGREARVSFSWLGTAMPGERAHLRAANVPVLEATEDTQRAELLAGASFFIHASRRDHVQLVVAQAMAAGTPCLLSDTPPHRALIRHGETGFICTSERDFIEKSVLLMRDRSEAKRIGEAARAEALRRFTTRHFEGAILRAYGFSRGMADVH
jgi:hypothetical protein